MTDNSKLLDTLPLPPPKKQRRGITLRSPGDVIRLLNKRINAALDQPTAENLNLLRVITYAASTILKAFEVGQMEDRLKALEEALETNKNEH